MKETIILSVGGSLIVPGVGLNTPFLIKLNRFIRTNISADRRFFLVAGGGATARHYIDAGREVVKKLTHDDLDWLGIHSTRLNAHLLRTIFRDIAHPRIVENYDKKIRNAKEPLIIGGGWKPGWSTDYCAVTFAKDYGANLIINMSNVYHVYDKDPKKFADAKIIEKTTWSFYETLVGDKWTPGLNTPFDPIAAQLSKRIRATVIITKGDDFANLQRILNGESFKGSVIRPYDVSNAYYDRKYYLGEKDEWRHRYQKALGFWQDSFKWTAKWYRALYIKFFLNPRNVLDVGCGTGELVQNLRTLGVDAYGVDISKDAINMAPPHIKQYLKHGDLMQLPFDSDSFELVVSLGVLEHIERQKIRSAVKETIRVAKKHIMHRIHTRENMFRDFLYPYDKSNLSVFPQGFWDVLFSSLKETSLVRKYFRLPSALESLYLLKKN